MLLQQCVKIVNIHTQNILGHIVYKFVKEHHIKEHCYI